jgi:hypothetical protein
VQAVVQRLFSTFPCGPPGVGLILVRAVAAIPLLYTGLAISSSFPERWDVVAAAAALFLLIGLWTPLAGALMTVAEVCLAIAHPAAAWPHLQFAVLGTALALLGPGGCSLDARLFGRKEIQIPPVR